MQQKPVSSLIHNVSEVISNLSNPERTYRENKLLQSNKPSNQEKVSSEDLDNLDNLYNLKQTISPFPIDLIRIESDELKRKRNNQRNRARKEISDEELLELKERFNTNKEKINTIIENNQIQINSLNNDIDLIKRNYNNFSYDLKTLVKKRREYDMKNNNISIEDDEDLEKIKIHLKNLYKDYTKFIEKIDNFMNEFNEKSKNMQEINIKDKKNNDEILKYINEQIKYIKYIENIPKYKNYIGSIYKKYEDNFKNDYNILNNIYSSKIRKI